MSACKGIQMNRWLSYHTPCAVKKISTLLLQTKVSNIAGQLETSIAKSGSGPLLGQRRARNAWLFGQMLPDQAIVGGGASTTDSGCKQSFIVNTWFSVSALIGEALLLMRVHGNIDDVIHI